MWRSYAAARVSTRRSFTAGKSNYSRRRARFLTMVGRRAWREARQEAKILRMEYVIAEITAENPVICFTRNGTNRPHWPRRRRPRRSGELMALKLYAETGFT